MFETDDFDQILSQFDIPGEAPNKECIGDASKISVNVTKLPVVSSIQKIDIVKNCNTIECNVGKENLQLPPTNTSPNVNIHKETFVSPKHIKRKIIDSHFDHKSKRKFPGPAGLLTGTLESSNDESLCQLELLSQDLEFSQNNARRDLFESPIWLHLLEDVKSWNVNTLDSIKSIKQQALAGNLRLRKAQTVTAFVETVDRSVTDPLIILRDTTGHIKCTLHRDAWSNFSPYIVSEYCALMLRRPTVLTTGSAFKKHYLNITLSNIYAIYSSAVLKEEEKQLPEGYVRVFEDDFTVIKMIGAPEDLGDKNISNTKNEVNEESNLLDDLDSIFSDDLF